MLSLDAYTHLQEVATAAQDAVYPNVEAVVKKLAPGNVAQQNELRRYAADCIRPAVQYFLRKFNHHNSPLFANVAAYKSARLCCPQFIAKTMPPPTLVDDLRSL
eukprot:scpid77720/ scgid25892/ 